ncbi:hypothetical protein MPTK1_2g13550 [Marchantia polymorpha subsp. ruderalis]|uniref:Uncharacterized protein n=1 Tax=Marchantia polymorpha TaxID=3197 RepID=A0A2R6XAH1_MARPO|nr:hypothetical protein MARPO_0026s0016 [Marchantia polymorpha]BBN02203.1 hypothetical protein Mp_2g13550 [Marchantia polymorpha subsp. ruderalis]|eukprot:PTQ43115.1 hypothetical protein MARPO_0026s0016 [Marchantia polymorpha]
MLNDETITMYVLVALVFFLAVCSIFYAMCLDLARFYRAHPAVLPPVPVAEVASVAANGAQAPRIWVLLQAARPSEGNLSFP